MSNEKAIRILVADDHYVVRMGIIALVNTEPDMEVVGEAADGNQAVELFQRLSPNLVLMDLRMPAKDGITATKEIRDANPDARVLMLTTYDGDTEIHRAMEAGAQGYVLKNSTGDKLIPALRAVAAGGKWIPREIALRLAARKMFEELTPRDHRTHRQGSFEEHPRQVARGRPNRGRHRGAAARHHPIAVINSRAWPPARPANPTRSFPAWQST